MKVTKKWTRTEQGCAGHLIVAAWCLWRRHTQLIGPLGAFRVSSVGNYYPDHAGNQRQSIGSGKDAFFETMVFPLTDKHEDGSEGCGCYLPTGWSELACQRYATAGEAQAGHEAMVERVMRGGLVT